MLFLDILSIHWVVCPFRVMFGKSDFPIGLFKEHYIIHTFAELTSEPVFSHHFYEIWPKCDKACPIFCVISPVFILFVVSHLPSIISKEIVFAKESWVAWTNQVSVQCVTADISVALPYVCMFYFLIHKYSVNSHFFQFIYIHNCYIIDFAFNTCVSVACNRHTCYLHIAFS